MSLPFLSLQGIVAVRQALQQEGCPEQAEALEKWMSWPPTELETAALEAETEEASGLLLGIYLWRQRHGDIRRDLQEEHQFEVYTAAWPVHRAMAENGYDVSRMLVPEAGPFPSLSYADAFQAELGEYESEGGESEDSRDPTSISALLAVLGPRVESLGLRGRADSFIESVLGSWRTERRLDRLDPTYWPILMWDAARWRDESWPMFRDVAQRVGLDGLARYPALILCMRLYGDEAADLIRGVDVVGGHSLLDQLTWAGVRDGS